MLTRRTVLVGSAVAAVAAATPGFALEQDPKAAAPAAPPAPPPGPFSLPALPYAFDALEPHFDAQTMMLHHGKHHATYVAKLNEAVAGRPELAGKSVEDLVSKLDAVPEAVRTAVRNHGGGHANHSLWWQTLTAPAASPRRPTGELAKALDQRFGSFDAWTEQMTKAALGVFGSGWAWLSLAPDKTLSIETTPNQDTPLSAGRRPLLGIDVWEHAYYLKYQNRRADFVAAWLKLIHWDFVSGEYARRAIA